MKTYTGKEMVRLLERHGWRVSRIRGSHHILARADREEVIAIPIHGNKDLKAGMVNHILKVAGIEAE